MITIQNIIDWSIEHPVAEGGRIIRIYNNNLEFSIVGGSKGLYGDFKDTFELAIFDVRTGDFRTKFFYPDNGDVIGYMTSEELVGLVNQVFKYNDFQVR